MAGRSERAWLAQSAQLSHQSVELRAQSKDLLRRAREQREKAMKLVQEIREMFGSAADDRDRLIRSRVAARDGRQ